MIRLPHLVKFMLWVFLAGLACSPVASGAERPINCTLLGVAIKGFDPVAYFTDQKPTKGDARFSWEWNSASWHFATREHLNAFRSNPEKYAPQYGGYCSWAVSRGHTANFDPDAWNIVNGKLYLTHSREAREAWEQDMASNIAKADVNWPKLLQK